MTGLNLHQSLNCIERIAAAWRTSRTLTKMELGAEVSLDEISNLDLEFIEERREGDNDWTA